jgi:hypothetical protein
MVRSNPEEFVDLVQHFPVLTGDRHNTIEVLGFLQGNHNRCHFDGLRTGTENRHDSRHRFPQERQRVTTRCYRNRPRRGLCCAALRWDQEAKIKVSARAGTLMETRTTRMSATSRFWLWLAFALSGGAG